MLPHPPAVPISPSAAEWNLVAVQVLNWLVEAGDDVQVGDLLAEVGRPGVVGDVRATHAGKVSEIRHHAGEWVTASTVIGWIIPETADPESD